MACRWGFTPRIAVLTMSVMFVGIVCAHADTKPIGVTLRGALVSSVRHNPADPSDEVIRRGVEKALYDLDSRANADIRVVVQDGTVWLTGSVPTWQGNDARLHATRSVIGVRSIINSLRVVPPSDVARL